MFCVVDAKPIASAGSNIGLAKEISVFFGLQSMKGAPGVLYGAFLQHEIDLLCLRCPYPEVRFAGTDQFGSDRITTFVQLTHGTLSTIAQALVVLLLDFAFHLADLQITMRGTAADSRHSFPNLRPKK